MIKKTFSTAMLAVLLITPPLWAMNGGSGHGHGGEGTAEVSNLSEDSSHMGGSHGNSHRGAHGQGVDNHRHHGDSQIRQDGNRGSGGDHHTAGGQVERMN